ncbi:PH domain-containing protein [Shewanella amazonensis]|uniref:Membrane protein n=1 Tax=Shewanella amazonensis (strain ATCC BAA-1098 / SB2B) TaxID=326297 RepID=A1S9Q9_SHEAM|nr:PH domain-containing protein [Shewanella amazonensis]ABM01116.1 membrane protein [Shewanella amazonensis SB2B]
MSATAENWQSLSPWSVVSFTLGTARQVLTQGYALIPIVFTGWKQGFDSPLVISVALLVLLGILTFALVQYATYRFRPGSHKLEVRRGLFFKRKDELPLDKIQNVRLDQPFYFKPLLLCTLVVETAGSRKDEVQIAAMPLSNAMALKSHLLQKPAEPVNHHEEQTDSLLLERGGKPLFLFGLYHNNFVWFMVFAGSIMGQLPVESWFESLGLNTFVRIESQGPLWGTLSVIALILLGYICFALISVLFAFLKYYPYRLKLGAESTLERTGGILAHQQDALAMKRIQLVEFNQPPIARLLKRWTVFFRQVQGHEVEQHLKLPLLIPSVTPDELPPLFAQLKALPGQDSLPPQVHELRPIHNGWLKRRLAFVWLPALLTMLISRELVVIELALTVAILGSVGLWLRFKHWGYRHDDTLVWQRTGLLGQSIKRVPLYKVQHVSLLQSPGQRKKGLATLELGLASGKIFLPWIPYSEARTIALAALTQLDKHRGNWI